MGKKMPGRELAMRYFALRPTSRASGPQSPGTTEAARISRIRNRRLNRSRRSTMPRKDAIRLGSRLLAVLLTVWALSELASLPTNVYAFLHYADQESVFSPALHYWRHHYLLSVGFLIVRIMGFSLAARWLYKCGPDVEEFLLPLEPGAE
jgi:ABC-type anion transport system duplicated permease subunit